MTTNVQKSAVVSRVAKMNPIVLLWHGAPTSYWTYGRYIRMYTSTCNIFENINFVVQIIRVYNTSWVNLPLCTQPRPGNSHPHMCDQSYY